MAGLSYATAARIAVRELRSSRAKFAFVVLSVAIGVAALTGLLIVVSLHAAVACALDHGRRSFRAQQSATHSG